MNILIGTVCSFGALMFLWNVVFPDLVPEFIQRLVYLLMALMCGAVAYDALVLGTGPFL